MPAYHCSRTVASWVILNRVRKGCPPIFILQVRLKVSLGPSKFPPNLAQRKANGPWLTLLCFISTRLSPFLLASPEWNFTVTTLRLAQTNIPHFFEGCHWLAGFKTLWCLSTTRRTDGQIARWLAGPTKAAFHPSIHPSIDRSSTPGPAASPCKSFWDYNGLLQVTLQQGTLHAGWISQNLFKWQT